MLGKLSLLLSLAIIVLLIVAPLDGCTSPMGPDGVRWVMVGLASGLGSALLLAVQGLRAAQGRRWAVYAAMLGLICVLGISVPVVVDEWNRLGEPHLPAQCPTP